MISGQEVWHNLILISAWNDSGGAYTHRLFDGHPGVFCWPFEMQLGTTSSGCRNYPWLKGKFRWPVFPPNLTEPQQAFDQILDTELKERLKYPEESKFRNFELHVSFEEWKSQFCRRFDSHLKTGGILRCYLQSYFDVDRGYPATGSESGVVGHCPNIIVDSERILNDFPDGRILHIVRCPLAGIVDMRRRNPQLTALEYGTRWNAINAAGGVFSRRDPNRVRLVSLRELVSEPRKVMSGLCEWLKLDFAETLLQPTWRGTPISLWGPFGGLRGATGAHEQSCASLVSQADRDELLRCTAEARALLNLDVLTEGAIA